MRNRMGRRNVLKTVEAAAAGLGASKVANLLPFSDIKASEPSGNAMPMRPLGKTGYNVKLFGLGGETIYGTST